MTRIRLYVEQSLRTPPAEAMASTGEIITVPFLRVFVFLRLGTNALRVQDAIVDPGAPVTIVPRKKWTPVADEIDWIHPPSGVWNSWLGLVGGKGGGKVPCRPGRISMTALDVERPPKSLSAVSVLALFEQEVSDDDRTLVGLHESILQGRCFHLNVDERQAWIEDL